MKMILILAASLSVFGCERNELSWQKINNEITNKFSDVEHINLDQFIRASENDTEPLIIDVREPEEFAVSHIPGAINLTDTEEIAELAKTSQRDVIVYCSVGYRSAVVAQSLQEMGVEDVTNFQGSIFAWANAGKPLENQTGTTLDVHPFDNYWGQLLEEDVPKRFETN